MLATNAAADPVSLRYSVTDLGSVGFVNQLGYTPDISLNEKGDVAWHIEDGKEAFLWTNGRQVSLGDMERVAVRADGKVIGLRVPDPAHVVYNGTMYHTVLWDNGHVTDLGPSGALDGQDMALTAAGIAVGTIDSADKGDPFTHTPPGSHVALWKDGTMTDLGTMGDRYGVATGINGKGQVIGFSAPAGVHEQRGFLWDKGRYTDLGSLPGCNGYAPVAISDQGYVAGWGFSFDDIKTHMSTGPDRAFLWEKGKMRDLGTLGGPDSHARAVNDSGDVVGESDTPNGRSAAFLYHDGKMTNLNTLVPAPGDVMQDVAIRRRLSIALAINDRRQIVVLGNSLNNVTHAFLLTPTSLQDQDAQKDKSSRLYPFHEATPIPEAGGFGHHGHAVLSLAETHLVRSRSFMAAIRVYNDGGLASFYNVCWNRFLPLPGALALYDARKHYLGDLLASRGGSLPSSFREDWTLIQGAGCAGVGMPCDALTVPAGTYYLQVIFFPV